MYTFITNKQINTYLFTPPSHPIPSHPSFITTPSIIPFSYNHNYNPFESLYYSNTHFYSRYDLLSYPILSYPISTQLPSHPLSHPQPSTLPLTHLTPKQFKSNKVHKLPPSEKQETPPLLPNPNPLIPQPQNSQYLFIIYIYIYMHV